MAESDPNAKRRAIQRRYHLKTKDSRAEIGSVIARPLPPLQPKDIERFWASIHVGQPDECWPWLRSTTKDGYGRFKLSNVQQNIRRDLKATRVAYFLFYKEDPSELLVLHTCDNPPCCNPAHLFLGTTKDNMLDKAAKGRSLGGDKNFFHQHPEAVRRGGQHHKARLTRKQVEEIRARFSSGGITRMELAREYEIGWSTVNHIICGDTWKILNE